MNAVSMIADRFFVPFRADYVSPFFMALIFASEAKRKQQSQNVHKVSCSIIEHSFLYLAELTINRKLCDLEKVGKYFINDHFPCVEIVFKGQ